MDNATKDTTDSGSKLMRYGMMACCAVMALPVVAFLVGGGTIAAMWSNVGLFAPILLCVGAHLVMHKMMGKSCHAKDDTQDSTDLVKVGVTNVPNVKRTSAL